MRDTIKWLSMNAAIHKHQAKSVKNKKKKAIHRRKLACYQMALNAYLKPVDKSCLTTVFGLFSLD